MQATEWGLGFAGVAALEFDLPSSIWEKNIPGAKPDSTPPSTPADDVDSPPQ